MRRKLIIAALVLFILATALFLLWPSPADHHAVEPAGFAAPDFAWRDFAGQEHRLATLKDRVVVLHFWASWCAPCRAEFPQLLQTARELPDITFLAISSDNDRAKAEKFLQEMGAAAPRANFLTAWDPKKSVTYDVFLTAAFPETIILDRQHRQRRKIPGVAEWQNQEFRDYLRGLAKD